MTKKELIILLIALSSLAVFSISTALAGDVGWSSNPQAALQQNDNGNENDNNDNENENSDDNDNDNGNDNSDDEPKAYGDLISFPEGLIGEWVIDGLTVTADSSTEFDEEEGPFAIGQCVEIEYDPTTLIATKIETEEAYKCNGSTFTNKAYGAVDVVPTTGYGEWTIGGVIYLATEGQTELEDGAGSAAVGDCVEVKYFAENGVNHAVEIELEDEQGDCSSNSSPDIDNDKDESKIYAPIVEFPTAPYTGTWNIGGELFEATATTEFEKEDGPFAVDQCVEAEYELVNGSKILLEVETEDSYKCQLGNGGDESSSYGTIETLPSTAELTGDWVVSGITYTVSTTTTLEEEYGLFAVGAYVEVYYVVSGNAKLATKIETHVAPGAGSNDDVGAVDNYDPSDDWADWTINGVTYKADPVIEVNDAANGRSQINTLVGQTVIFNSYQQNGVNYLTSVSVAQQIYLPTIMR